jgi:hypothetical protein
MDKKRGIGMVTIINCAHHLVRQRLINVAVPPPGECIDVYGKKHLRTGGASTDET